MMRSLVCELVCLSLFVAASPAPAAELPRVPENIRRLMQDRQYAKAVDAMDAVLQAKPADDAQKNGEDANKIDRDYLAYLKGRALQLDHQYDAAVKAYDEMNKQFPKSPWARRARFAKGVTLARKGDFRAAELVYRAEAQFLLSDDRKQEIAAIYLEFADAFFKPEKDDVQPDYKRALEFYQRALDVGPKRDSRMQIELRIARCHQKLGNNADAVRLHEKFVKQYPDSPLAIEARFRLGESQMAAGARPTARRTWQDLLAAHKDAKSELLPEAAYKIAGTYNLPQPHSDEQLTLGVAALRSFLKTYPEHKLASAAHLTIAKSYQHRGRFEDAVDTLQGFLADERYADREEVPDARRLLGLSLQRQRKWDEALAAWRDYLAKHPTHKSWSDVQRAIIDTEYLKADAAFGEEKFEQARKLWEQFLVKYPLDGRNRAILYRFGQMEYKAEKWDEAIEAWRRLVSKYPDTNESSQAQLMIAVTLEEKLGKLEEALKEYKKLTWGNFQSHAQRRIARLTARQLEVVTPRVFRSDETPQLTCTTRNIEALTVQLYTVDLETYFRKMHLASGVEGLDTALIDPDKTFEFQVPEYQQYQELENQVEVPLPKAGDADEAPAGVMVVTVSSKTLEATTLVVQSDLDIVVKSSRDETLVFAQNMRTGAAWPAARVLASNGDKVFAEAATGDDGVFRGSYDELKSADDLRVFAIDGPHVASNVIGLSGVQVTKGLAAKGYIYTDRPAYRPGQMVHVRGVIRRVRGDTYTVDKGREYKLSVFDNRNRMLAEEDVKLGDFGSFHTHFLLPAAASLGDYRLLVQDAAGKESYQGTFTVHQYQLEPVRIEVETARNTYYRGEEISGTIRVQFYYGAPLVGREIRYQLADGRLHTAKSDDKGEIQFTLPTRQFREAQPLQLTAVLPERNLIAGRTVFLATQGFRIEASTVRSVYLAGDTFEVTVKTIDAEGKPVAQPLNLSVLEKTKVNGKVGERQVAAHELKTDEKTGTARQTLRLDEGGRYVLRLAGTDRFDNPITGETTVHVSDDGDRVRLRILADKHTFKVGDEASVQLHWREEPALALVTFEGARILEYKLVNLQQGANKLAIPMTAKLAPNFELSVAVMTDPRKAAKADAKPKDPTEQNEEDSREPVRLHSASSPFTVQRELILKLAIAKQGDAKDPPRPGDDVEVTITATDPQGKPVSAELSLALVEQALLSQYQSPLAAIADFFRGARRQCSMRTTSSITFAYRPATQPINPRLLAEEDRLAVEEDERRRLEALSTNIGGGVAGGFGGVPSVTSVIPAVEAPNAPSSVDPSGLDDFAQQAEAQPWGADANDGDVFFHTLDVFGRPQRPGQGQQGGQLGGSRFQLEGAQRSGSELDRAGDWQGELSLVISQTQNVKSTTPAYHRLTADYFRQLQLSDNHEVQILDRQGKWANVNLARAFDGKPDAQKVQELVNELNAEGAVALPQLPPHETGYWNPSIVTDDEGKAKLTFTLPERSTAWKLLAKGVTLQTLAGEAEDRLTVKKDLFGQLKLPASFTDGDQAQIQASVHNAALDKVDVTVTLKTSIGGKTVSQEKTLEGLAQGVHELTLPAAIELPAETAGAPDAAVAFELIVEAGEQRDAIRRAVPIRPFGMRVFSLDGGTAEADALAFVDAPEGMPLTSPQLQIVLGPSVERSLLDVVLAPPTWCQVETSNLSAGGDRAVSDLLASLALLKLVDDARDAQRPQAEAIDARVRGTLSVLIASQNDDGGWSWTTRGGQSNRYNTARVVWGLSLAREAGYRVPADNFDRAVAYLLTQMTKTAVTDYETKVILLHGLTVAGRDDFPLANQLYRNRNNLSTAGLLHLVLVFAEMNRKQTAGELLTLAAERPFTEEKPKRQAAGASLPWNHAEAELRALYALGLEMVSPTGDKLPKQVDWLMAHRTGHRWSPDKATGPATLVLARWFARTRFAGERYKLTLFVNDLKLKELQIDAASLTQTIDVPVEMLKKDKRQVVRFEITGRGRFTYQCVLGGFVPAGKLASTTEDWKVTRHFEPAPRELDGEEIPRGFDVLQGGYQKFRNDLKQLPVARRGQVELNISRYNVRSGTPSEHLEYLVVTEPLPAGTTVVEQSVRGGFERFEISAGAITFYVGSRQHVASIHYDIHGYLPGSYRAVPTLVRDAYQPDKIAVSATKPLEVLPLGGASKDPYRLTPRELFELGRRLYDKHQYAAALPHLTELVDKWNLRPEFHKEAARMLLDIHLEKGPAHLVVKYFEIVMEKYPELEIPFAKLIQIGDAYHKIGEYERSYLVFRTTVETSFMKESQVAGFLEGRGQFLRSVDVMGSLIREYPPEAYVAAATYALAQRVYAKAPEAASDEKLREKKITRIDLISQALARLDGFLTAYPEDPAADQASFSLASAMLDLDVYDKTIAACQRYAERFPESDYLDSFWYIIAFCHYARGEHEQALEMSRKVAEAKRKQKGTGRMVESENKWRAIYIMGQIYHSLGEAAKAIERYTEVRNRFADARAAIEYFARKEIKLPEVSTYEPGKPVDVELKFRNVPACDTKVYRIDLMKFGLLKRNLEGIRDINLSGIRPYHEAQLELGDGKDYQDRTAKLALPLKEQGAYLVVCRGDDLHTSGLVLVSPLKVEVQEDQTSGQVRTTVRNVIKDSYVDDVHVKVIGSNNSEFVAGETDLRGVFVADAIQGTSTVIAQLQEDQYAFHRGTQYLGAPPAPAEEPDAPKEAPSAKGKPGGKAELLEQLRKGNEEIQQEQTKQLQDLYDNTIEGGAAAGGVF